MLLCLVRLNCCWGMSGKEKAQVHALPAVDIHSRIYIKKELLFIISTLCPAKSLVGDGSCLLWWCQQVHRGRLDWCNNHIIQVVSPFSPGNTEKELSIMCSGLPFKWPFSSDTGHSGACIPDSCMTLSLRF